MSSLDVFAQLDSAIRFLAGVVQEQEKGLLSENRKKINVHFFEANRYTMHAIANLQNCAVICRKGAGGGGESPSSAVVCLERIASQLRSLAMTMSKAYSHGLGPFAPGEAIPALTRVKTDTASARDELAALRAELDGTASVSD